MNKLFGGMMASAVVMVAACGGTTVIGSGGSATTNTSSGSGPGTGAGTTTTTSTSNGATTSTASTTNTSASVGTVSSTSGTGGSPVGQCPGSQPAAGSSCPGADASLRCTYGDSVRPDCRDVYMCNGGQWQTTGTACIEPPPSECGTTEPPANTVCPNMGDVCTYGNDICYCGCGGGIACLPPVDWSCSSPPTTPGCPQAIPNDGTTCNAEGVECTYGNPCTPAGAVVDCTGGYWRWNEMIACAGASE